MTIDISAGTRRVVYTGSAGLGPYAFTFELLDDDDIAVYFNTTLLTKTSDYTVAFTSGTQGAGSVTIVTGGNVSATPTSSDTITLLGKRAIERTTDFVTAGDLRASALNEEFDAQVVFSQQIDEKVDRSLKGNFSDPTTLDYTLPSVDNRKGRYLAFNSTTGAPEAGASTDDVNTLSDITDDIATLADIEDGTDATDAIQTVAGIAPNVTTVAGISGNVTTVAGNTTNINTVAGNTTNINTVAGDTTDINALSAVSTEIGLLGNASVITDMSILGTADVVADMNTLGTADVVADMNTLGTADVVADMNTLATTDIVADMSTLADISTDITAVADISTEVTAVAGDATDIGTVAGISSSVTTVAGISPNVTTVAGISSQVTTVAGDSTDIQTVAGDSSDIQTVAGNTTNINTVAGANTNISTVATNIANVNTTAANITGVNSFGERYRVGSSDPTTSLDEGDLAYNTTDNALKYYNGTSWASITAGLGNIVEDATPQLGGNLDLNSNNITGTGDITATGDLTITGSASIDNIDINGNAITSTDTDGNIALTPNGTGEVDISKVDIDSGAIDGTTIGGTTAAAGTFTTLTASGDLTVDTDTLHVDSTNNRVGINDATPSEELDINGDGSDVRIRMYDGAGASVGRIEHSGANFDISNTATSAATMTFTTGSGSGSERMRIDGSGNVDMSGNLTVGDGTDISMSSSSDGQLMLDGNGYTAGIALNSTGMHIYHNSSIRDIIFGINNLEYFRMKGGGTANGRFGINNNNPSYPIDASIGTTGSAATHFRFKIGSDSYGGGIWCKQYYGANAIGRTGGNAEGIQFTTNAIAPADLDVANGFVRDNAMDLGTSSNRWDDVRATNGTIQTSDQNLKQNIAVLTDAEINAAKAISGLFKTYKWIDKVEAKGDDARTHTGVIAQEVQQAMTDNGLDATKYAFWCSDTWWEGEQTATTPDGEEITGTVIFNSEEEAPEGATEVTRLSIRYPELLAFIGAATEQRLADIETRLTALEAE